MINKVVKFKNEKALKAFVAEADKQIKEGIIPGFCKYMMSAFDQDTMVFTHGAAKDDAVQTGDSMNITLFAGMALMALLGAAAVFATRREQ